MSRAATGLPSFIYSLIKIKNLLQSHVRILPPTSLWPDFPEGMGIEHGVIASDRLLIPMLGYNYVCLNFYPSSNYINFPIPTSNISLCVCVCKFVHFQWGRGSVKKKCKYPLRSCLPLYLLHLAQCLMHSSRRICGWMNEWVPPGLELYQTQRCLCRLIISSPSNGYVF